jgi:hypothetical protein
MFVHKRSELWKYVLVAICFGLMIVLPIAAVGLLYLLVSQVSNDVASILVAIA